jgi:hypothetical protein
MTNRDFNDYLIYISDEMLRTRKRIINAKYKSNVIEIEKNLEYLRGLYNGVAVVKNMLLCDNSCYVSYLNELLDMYEIDIY